MGKGVRIKRERIWEADFFRGFSILMVVWDHAMVACSSFIKSWKTLGLASLVKLGEFGNNYCNSDLRLFWRPVFLFIFFFTSGVCTAFSKNNFYRGLRVGGAACAVSWGTYVFSMLAGDDWFILLGVLHCIALIILSYCLISSAVSIILKLTGKITKKEISERGRSLILGCVCLILSVVCIVINKKYNVDLYDTTPMPSNPDSMLKGLFFFSKEWATEDYFPLFPFISFFLLGAGLAPLLYPKKRSLFPSLDGKWNLPFTTAGRQSLIIYVFSQIAVFGLLTLITFMLSGEFLLGV